MIRTKELALIVVLASFWITAQVVFGQVVGRFSFGPIRMHGAVNHIVGWFLMTIMAEITRRFGRVSYMTVIAALGTRVIRASTIEGMLVGLGYIIAGFLFDLLYFSLPLKNTQRKKLLVLLITIPTSIITLVPFLVFRYYILGPVAFLVLIPSYSFSMIRNIVLSTAGVLLAFSILPRIKEVYKA